MTEAFGKYDLIAALGSGGMADVHLAAVRGPAEFRKLVVLKRLRAEIADCASFTNMLLDEAQIAARLEHPNVVKTFDVGVHDGQHYIAMEYLDGQPVGAILRTGRPELPHTTRIMADVLAGLEYAHTLTDYDGRPLSIVHRDISPQNLFVTYGGEVKVVDFGIAKATLRTSERTEEGVLKGKPSYMSPEQLNGETLDARTDVFAAGVVMWELLTGRRLFAGASAVETAWKITGAPIQRASEVASDVPPELDSVCMGALERDRSRRWPSAGAMREALYAYVEGGPGRAARGDELGRYVAARFERERTQMRGRITEFMSEHRQAAADLRSGEVTLPSLPGRVSQSPMLGDPTTAPTLGAPTTDASQTPLLGNPNTAVMLTQPRGAAGGAATGSEGTSARRSVAIAGAIAACVILGGAALYSRMRASGDERADRGLASAQAPALAPIVTIEGSGTLGTAAPLMLEGFFKKRGATGVRRARGERPTDVLVIATTDHGPETILVRNEGTAGGFKCLAAKTCDVAMAAREIQDAEAAEAERLGLGDLRSPGSEHFVALDGIAVVVGSANPVRALDLEQIADLFSGVATDWSKVGGPPGPVTIVAHAPGSGTRDFFDAVVLGGRPLAAAAKQLPDNPAIADAVAGQANAIGFLGFAFVRGARALAVGDRGVQPMIPSTFSVTTERYLLSRRFYFYTPQQVSQTARDLVEYVTSHEGQQAIRSEGFVDLEISLKNHEPCERCPARYVAATKQARRLSLDFRFRQTGDRLDSRAARDVDRVVRFLRDTPTSRLLLLGFSDASGDAKADIRRSRELAQLVDAELGTRGVRASLVDGFGGEMPVAANASAWGKTKNRRVEIWVR